MSTTIPVPSRRRRTVMMLSWSGRMIAMPVSARTRYFDVVSRFTDEWPSLMAAGLSFRYKLGDYSNCVLRSDNDFSALIMLLEDFNSSRVDVQVVVDISQFEKEQPSPPSVQRRDQPTVNESARPVIISQALIVTPSPEIPHYDVCPPISELDKLSESWCSNITGVGQKFLGGNQEFRQELSKYALVRGFKYHFMRNNTTSISVYCHMKVSAGCMWRISGTSKKHDPVFTIHKAQLIHNCTDHLIKDDQLRLTPRTMGSLFVQDVQNHSGYSGKAVKDELSKSFGLKVGYMKAWRTLQAAKDTVYGAYEDSFNQLRWYSEAVKQTNPGSIVDLQSCPNSNQFHRFFIAYHACLVGFKSCRPILFIDATSTKGRYKGQLLSAVAKDGDNGLFTVAMALVDLENIDNWTWFISKLRDHVLHDQKVSCLSDRHAGILAAFPIVFDEPVHFFCLYHLYTNLKGMYRYGWSLEFRKKMVKLLGRAAHAPTPESFHTELDVFIKDGGPQALKFLEDLPYEKWAVAFSPGIVRYGEMTSNAAESFNNMIKPFRGLPVCHMIDGIRQHIMGLFNDRRADSSTWTGALTPKKEMEWNVCRKKGRGWKILKCPRDGVYEVISKTTQTVDTQKKTCSCFQWQLDGFPCIHAVNVIAYSLPTISGIVDRYFFTSTFREAYASDIMPVPTSMRGQIERSLPFDNPILPPDSKSTAGRPKRKRILSFGEKEIRKTAKFQCPYCTLVGKHDTNTCAQKLADEFIEGLVEDDL